MEEEASSFESSEMLANILASTPILSESWKVCSHANLSSSLGFVANQVGEVIYVGFSGFGAVAGMDPSLRNLVPLDTCDGIFSGLQTCRRDENDDQSVMVHAGFLNLFLAVYRSPYFQNQILEIMNKNKPVVFTGHSIGGTIASLSALWLLSSLKSLSTSLSILCVTFGSPLLGNEPLSRSILHQRWGGNFCHVIAKHDIVPRLLFAPLTPLGPHLHSLLQHWHQSVTSPYFRDLAVPLPENEKSELFHFVLAHIGAMALDDQATCRGSLTFWPFGNFVFTSEEGAVCLDNGLAIVKLLHLMLAMGCPSSSVEDHLKYGDYIGEVSMQYLKRKSGFMEEELPQSSYDAGVALALQSSGISSQEPVFDPAKDCLKMAKRMGRAPNLNSAHLAICLSKITPLRAQIEWYKTSCDESEDQMGYYDSFKQRGASRKGSKVNMNRIKLATFWDELILMLETEQLPHDFHSRLKWVNASQFYKLLVEPLDIAEYYRSGVHRTKGHYISHGRARRYEIFDRWWRERRVGEEENKKRSKFASLTQDTCFWARVEEAREWLESIRSERDQRKQFLYWENIGKFEEYAREMIKRKEVSKDVLQKNSSYSVWVEELGELKSQLQRFPQVPGLLDGEVVP